MFRINNGSGTKEITWVTKFANNASFLLSKPTFDVFNKNGKEAASVALVKRERNSVSSSWRRMGPRRGIHPFFPPSIHDYGQKWSALIFVNDAAPFPYEARSCLICTVDRALSPSSILPPREETLSWPPLSRAFNPIS